MSRPLQGYDSNPSDKATAAVVLGASSIIFLVLAQPLPISQSWLYQRSCVIFVTVIGQKELMSIDLRQKQLWTAHWSLRPGTETRASHFTCCSATQQTHLPRPGCLFSDGQGGLSALGGLERVGPSSSKAVRMEKYRGVSAKLLSLLGKQL